MEFLKVEDLNVHFPVRGGILKRVVDHVKAVNGVSLRLEKGQTYGLVGESGSGKTTTGRAIIGLNEITSGDVFFEGDNLARKKRSGADRREIQMIFQDPYSSLNPKKRILDIIAEPLRNYEKLSKEQLRARVEELVEQVGLSKESIFKYPHEFSGGQRQRIGIARAIALNPKLIIADEPVSALDVSVQAQVLNFMKDIQKELNLTYLLISHDLGIIRHMCDRIGIMYKGRLVEEGSAEDIYTNPQHIYTKRLISAIPDIDPKNREKQAIFREEVKLEFKNSKDYYFDKDGLAFDLRQISDTHFVALPKEGQ
ncbi:peptide ABC transporter substrate-binding protein [Alkalihalobacillus alcalophilus ATCC 27647 = CGMCC 1.3604]|uniref:Oligopeptide transporter n=1 Tax=Alkalihalobacillus alcalophilus ATCC 27647 = CGMCC 1.3604 TaxID=1218173 RepID=J8TE70_ALKAL|nr:ATP-binding cassette domain-containing protein [Alkalihalobacillus alcalophilus]AFV25679.1 oligopeptide transporter [Alkalihalobacillus alcalophilus ATCC 27647 = CGMCC 1.3604]KGA96526.1 peptide ABC transporter substrate-binding protein [Alkalihalobacillus alcalophilus ATCC 27647 = CGMCC 1.3604]MED1561684.1 ATP-binding cassette domain-containing protein [Alkalihalobacillus alcalophilus]THG90920.1 peptide ABC transporter substrate-binding protein [Alkalihalobacillus alcalophilus ATCC 27647 = C